MVDLRRAMTRWGPVAIGLLLVLFGLACLNYTKARTFQHHQEWAIEHGMPAPSDTLFWGGVVSVACGAFAFGFSLARRRHAHR